MQEFITVLLICSVTMSALGIIYAALTPLLARRYSAHSRYYAWLIIVIGLIIPFRPSFGAAIVKYNLPNEPISPANGQGTAITAVIPSDITASTVNTPSVSLWQIAFLIWLVGIITFIVCHTIRHYRFTKMVKRWSEDVACKQALSTLESIKRETGITQQIGLYQCPGIGSPTLLGFVTPRILLPQVDFTPDELRFILTHELTHYKRGDLLYKCAVLLAAAIHWFNPVVYLLVKAIDTACELSCDAETVRGANADVRQQYGETIIGVVRYQANLKTALSTNFYGGKRGMKKRIYSIMDTGRKKTGAVILCLMLVLTLGTGMAFAAYTPTKSEPLSIQDTASVTQIYEQSINETVASGTVSTNSANGDTVEYDYSDYERFGITLRDEKLYYNSEPVRCFDDWYSLGENMYAGRSYFDKDGTVDIFAQRDFSQIVHNPDGSYDPSGKLVGVRTSSQAEFDARDIDALISPVSLQAATSAVNSTNYTPASSQGSDNTTAQNTMIATQSTDGSMPSEIGRSFEQIFEVYAEYGITFDSNSKNGGVGNVYYNGQMVKRFVDIRPNGIITNVSSSDGGKLTVRTVYDEHRNLTGLDVSGE